MGQGLAKGGLVLWGVGIIIAFLVLRGAGVIGAVAHFALARNFIDQPWRGRRYGRPAKRLVCDIAICVGSDGQGKDGVSAVTAHIDPESRQLPFSVAQRMRGIPFKIDVPPAGGSPRLNRRL